MSYYLNNTASLMQSPQMAETYQQWSEASELSDLFFKIPNSLNAKMDQAELSFGNGDMLQDRVPSTSMPSSTTSTPPGEFDTVSFRGRRLTGWPFKDMNPEEIERLRRSRKLECNRRNAKLARDRKKVFIDGLEKHLMGLQAIVEELTAKKNALQAENDLLRANLSLRQ